MSTSIDPAQDVASSIARGEPVADWWERAHRTQQQVWISGTHPIEIFARLTVMAMMRPGIKVLNVGVGTGACTRALAEYGFDVSTLDISRTALERVADVSTGYLASNIGKLPANTFDLALSHLVAQHMRNADLLIQIGHVIRSLKPGGVFAIQYAETIGGADTMGDDDSGVRGGGVLRSPFFFASLVEQAGGRVLWDQPREVWTVTSRVAHLTSLVERRR